MQQAIKDLLEVLNSGGLILYPTDVDWAVGCDAANEKAIEQLSTLLRKSPEAPFTILFDMPGKIQGYVEEVSDVAWDLMEMSENPLTLIVPGVKNLPAVLTGPDKSVGVRVTKHEFSRNLCTRFRRPLVYFSTGALSLSEVSSAIKEGVDAIADFQQEKALPRNHESIIRLGKGNLFQIVRE